jgi:uncharacterized protein (DUF1810 family)
VSAHDLGRFVDAQTGVFDTALAEIRAGHKRSHWMWFIFPQLRGLGYSAMAQHYGIASLDEAQAYLAHPLLGSRYRTCVEAVAVLKARDPVAIFGPTDAMKLRSSLTLFEAVEASPVIDQLLQCLFAGARDPATQRMLAASIKATD